MLRNAGTARAELRAGDWIAAVLIALLVSAPAIPGLIPLLLIQDGSNVLQIGLLLFAGYWSAHYSGSNRWLVGMAIALLGAALVLPAVPLGG